MPPLDQLSADEVRGWRDSVGGFARFYSYAIPAVTVPATDSVTTSTQIESAVDFYCTYVTGIVLIAATQLQFLFSATAMPRIQIVDQASGASLMDRADTLFKSVVGTAEFPAIWRGAHLFAGSTVVSVTFDNVSATPLLIQIAFHGKKRFRK